MNLLASGTAKRKAGRAVADMGFSKHLTLSLTVHTIRYFNLRTVRNCYCKAVFWLQYSTVVPWYYRFGTSTGTERTKLKSLSSRMLPLQKYTVLLFYL